MALDRQSAALPAAHPSYILRGHASQIHCVHFVHHNTRLLTGDGDGWVVYWKLETKRALAVWKAHDAAILGTAAWGRDKIITHGRDNALRIWQLRAADEAALSTTLPAEATADPPKPWLLHMLPVNTLNFCAFSMCYEQPANTASTDSILIAVPGRDDKKLEVYQFPQERLRAVVPRALSTDTGMSMLTLVSCRDLNASLKHTGMAMAVKLAHASTSNRVLVLTGYEGGLTAVHLLPRSDAAAIGVAQLIYLSQPHTQPVLSLDISPDAKTYFTSSADAIIAAHQIPEIQPDVEHDNSIVVQQEQDAPLESPLEPTDPAQPHLEPTSPTAPSNLSPSPPLTFEKTPLSFPKQPPTSSLSSSSKPSSLSTLLSSTPSTASTKPRTPLAPPTPHTPSPPYKTTSTKHAGQQSLAVRSDARLLATGGWDARIRIYSAKTLREVAVLKWHKEGVYAVAFGEVLSEGDVEALRGGGEGEGEGDGGTGLGRLQRRREEQMQMRHWVAAGAKDGKVSLWEVF